GRRSGGAKTIEERGETWHGEIDVLRLAGAQRQLARGWIQQQAVEARRENASGVFAWRHRVDRIRSIGRGHGGDGRAGKEEANTSHGRVAQTVEHRAANRGGANSTSTRGHDLEHFRALLADGCDLGLDLTRRIRLAGFASPLEERCPDGPTPDDPSAIGQRPELEDATRVSLARVEWQVHVSVFHVPQLGRCPIQPEHAAYLDALAATR